MKIYANRKSRVYASEWMPSTNDMINYFQSHGYSVLKNTTDYFETQLIPGFNFRMNKKDNSWIIYIDSILDFSNSTFYKDKIQTIEDWDRLLRLIREINKDRELEKEMLSVFLSELGAEHISSEIYLLNDYDGVDAEFDLRNDVVTITYDDGSTYEDWDGAIDALQALGIVF